jgi:hypothetical protein
LEEEKAAELIAEDHTAFEKAEQLNVEEGFEEYLASHSKGLHADAARRAVDSLKEIRLTAEREEIEKKAKKIEEIAYTEALQLGSVEKLKAYLTTYPEGEYVAEIAALLPYEVEWQKTLEGGRVGGVIETDDGGVILLRDTGSMRKRKAYLESWVTRLDSEGKTLWNRSYGEGSSFRRKDLIAGSDGSALLLMHYSSSSSSTEKGMRAINIDGKGAQQWSSFLGTGNFFGGAPVKGGGFVVVGVRENGVSETNKNFRSDLLLAKLGNEGQTIWKSVFDRGGTHDRISAFHLSEDNQQVLVSGVTLDRDGKEYSHKSNWITAFDLSGKEVWSRRLEASHGLIRSISDSEEGYELFSVPTHDSGENELRLISISKTGEIASAIQSGASLDEIGSYSSSQKSRYWNLPVSKRGEGCYVLAGVTIDDTRNTNLGSFVAMSVGLDGKKRWQRTIDIEQSTPKLEPSRVIGLSDGSYIVCGGPPAIFFQKESVLWMVKLSAPSL